MVKTELVEISPPLYLTEQTPVPSLKVETNAQLVEALINYKNALLNCNRDKEIMREF